MKALLSALLMFVLPGDIMQLFPLWPHNSNR